MSCCVNEYCRFIEHIINRNGEKLSSDEEAQDIELTNKALAHEFMPNNPEIHKFIAIVSPQHITTLQRKWTDIYNRATDKVTNLSELKDVTHYLTEELSNDLELLQTQSIPIMTYEITPAKRNTLAAQNSPKHFKKFLMYCDELTKVKHDTIHQYRALSRQPILTDIPAYQLEETQSDYNQKISRMQ